MDLSAKGEKETVGFVLPINVFTNTNKANTRKSRIVGFSRGPPLWISTSTSQALAEVSH